MPRLSPYPKGYRILYNIYYPDGRKRYAIVYRSDKRQAEQLLARATELETITRHNHLTRELAGVYLHYGLLKDADLQIFFPASNTLAFDAGQLLDAYERHCATHMTSASAIRTNMHRAKHLISKYGDLARATVQDVRAWQQERRRERASKTVNLEHDVLRQLLDICQQQGWRDDNPARAIRKLPWRQSRLPLALAYAQVADTLQYALDAADGQPPHSLRAQLYRIVVAGVYFGLRRGELQHLLASDNGGYQVIIQGKDLPGAGTWIPKSREARVIQYAGIERPIELVFGGIENGYVFSPGAERNTPFHYDSLSNIVGKWLLSHIAPGLSLHSLRHTFATWRLEQGDSLIRVRALMGHADANTLLRYAHVHADPMRDLLQLL